MAQLMRWKDANRALACFRQHYCPPDMPPLAIEPWIENDKDVPRAARCRLNGIYLMFDAIEEIQYVGVAMWSYSKRVKTHAPCTFVDVIPFEQRWLPLALTLEFVLIQRLDPPRNRSYRRYGLCCPHDPIPRPPNEAKG